MLKIAKLAGAAALALAASFGAQATTVNLSGADFTDACLTNAVRHHGINRADMEGVIGLDTAKGLID